MLRGQAAIIAYRSSQAFATSLEYRWNVKRQSPGLVTLTQSFLACIIQVVFPIQELCTEMLIAL